jgi:hypothetical protein
LAFDRRKPPCALGGRIIVLGQEGTPMTLNALFPRSIDNNYSGRKAALWLLAILVFVKGAMGVNSIFNGDAVATTADSIPLESFSPAGASAVLAFLALWGWSLLLFSLLGVLALVRYRALVPLVFLLLLLEQLGRKWILLAMPIAKAGPSPAFCINTLLMAAMVVGLALSLWSKHKPSAEVAS